MAALRSRIAVPGPRSDCRPILALAGQAQTRVSMRINKRVKAKKVLQQPSAARLARAEAEDRMDMEWLEECLRVLHKVAKERGLPWFEAFLAVDHPPLPPRPTGFERRRDYCNRCEERLLMSDEFDALYCGRCNRWIESTCSDPRCSYCSKRPERPVP